MEGLGSLTNESGLEICKGSFKANLPEGEPVVLRLSKFYEYRGRFIHGLLAELQKFYLHERGEPFMTTRTFFDGTWALKNHEKTFILID